MAGAGARGDSTWVLRVDGISFEANHGAFAPERRTRRRFEVDLEVRAPLDRPASSDRLADTIDYRGLCEAVVSVGTTKTYRLIEKLGAEILAACAALYPAAHFTVEVRKLAPPCPGNPTVSAVRLSRGPASLQ